MPPQVPTVSVIAARLGAHFVGSDQIVSGLATLDGARSGALTFVVDPVKYAESTTVALERGAVLLFPSGRPVPDAAQGSVVVVDNPRSSFAQAVSAFFAPAVEPGVAPTAVVHPSATIAPSAHVGPYSVIGPGAVIGESVEIRNHVVVAANARIGDHTLVKSHAVIGEEGFGIDKDKAGNNVRLPHLGSVVIGAHAEVGNFTTVCSGTITPTTIGDYSKIDDHVHVAHNVQIGRNCIVTACAEISGSVTVDDGVWIGPNASIIEGRTIGAGSLIGIGAVVIKSIPANEVQIGNPARRIRDNT